MKVGIYYSSLVYGSPQNWATLNRGLARYLWELDGRGIKTLLWAPRLTAENSGFSLPPSTQVVPLPPFERWWQGYANWWRLTKAFNRWLDEVSWIWLRYPAPMGWYLALKARETGLPLLVDVVGDTTSLLSSTSHYHGPLKFLAKTIAAAELRLLQRLARGAAFRLVNKSLVPKYAPYAAEMLIRPSGILVPEDFFPRGDTCSKHPYRLLVVSFLRPEKGVHVLLKALANWKGPSWVLDVVGEGPLRSQLEALSISLGLNGKVRFHGFIGDETLLRQFYRQADIFVLPSLSEGTPRTVLEAMAASLPIVATEVGGVPDILTDRETGLIVPPGDPIALGEALTTLLSDASLRQRLIRNSYFVANKFTVKAFINDVLALMKTTYGIEFGEGPK